MIDVLISGNIPAPLTTGEIERAIRLAFQQAKRPSRGRVSLAFVSETEMRRLNQTWRKIRHSTDVLSFPAAEVPLASTQLREWGDLFVSGAFVRREAQHRKIVFREELLRVILHGVLHLCGFDHAEKEEESRCFHSKSVSFLFFLPDMNWFFSVGRGFHHAWRSLCLAFRAERNFRIQVACALVVILLVIILQIQGWERILLLLAIGSVLVLELLNSTVERLVDLVKPRLHGYVHDIKDLMAAAVLLASFVAALIGLLILWPYIGMLFARV